VPSEKRARQRAAREQRLAAEAQARKRRVRLRNGGIIVVVAAVVVGIAFLVSGGGGAPKTVAGKSGNLTVAEAAKDANKTDQAAANKLAVKAGCPASPTARVNTINYTSAPPTVIDTSKLYSATIKTTAGTIVMSLYAKAAPNTVNNFVYLAKKGYFNCESFFRVVKGFVDQTGSNLPPNGEPTYRFGNENVPSTYATGDVAMANSSKADTNGSEFFFVSTGGGSQLSNTDGGYSLFGSVTSGMNVVDQINSEGAAATSEEGTPAVIQRILKVTIHEAAGL
jgi:cyclophilin family peptidyl-prolyl cis-trans isomerase